MRKVKRKKGWKAMPEAQILIVEDEYIVAKDIKNTLTNLGYSVPAIAASGEEALKKLSEVKPDLILMDIVLKGSMDGVQTADEIRTKFNIPVVYLTAYADDNTLQRAKITEPYGYLIKPFQERELHSTIEMALYKQKMEKSLKDNEQWLSTTLNSLGEGVIATNEKCLVTFINPVAEWLIKCKYEEELGKPLEEVLKIINEDTGKQVKNIMRRALAKDAIITLAKNSLLLSTDGSKIPITNSVAPIIDDNKEIIGVVVVITDITERKRAEDILRDSEERYRRLVDNFPEPMVVYSEGKLVYANPETIKLLSAMGASEIIGKSLIDFVHPDYQELILARIREIDKGKEIQKSIRIKLISLEGKIIDIDASAIHIIYHGKPAIQIVIRDITTSKRMEEELRESEEKYRNLVERANDGIVIIQDEKIKYINPRLEEITGYEAEEVIDTKFTNYLHPDEIKKGLARYKKRMASKKLSPSWESALVHKNGHKIEVEINGGLTTYQGKPADLIYIRDITERKEIENAIRESEEKYRKLLETSPDAIIVTDLNGKISMVNKQALDLYGSKTEEHLIGKNAIEFIIPEDRDRATEYALRVIKEGNIKNINYKVLKMDGTPFHAEISFALIKDAQNNPKGFIGIVRDISDRIRFDEVLRDSEEKYFNLFHKSNDSIFLHDLNGNIIDANQKALEMFGYKKSEILSFKIPKLHPKEALKKSKWAFDKISKDGFITFEIDFKRKNGEVFPAEVSSSIIEIKGKQVIQGIVRDITERREIEEAMQKSETQLRMILNSMGDAIHVVDNDMRFVMINRSFQQWNEDLGLTRDVVGKKLFEVCPFLLKKVHKEYKQVLKTGETLTTEEKTKIGDREFLTETRKIPILEKGKVKQIITAVRDITERKHAEEAYKRLVEHSLQGLIIIQERGIVYANPAITEITGYTQKELYSLALNDFKKIIHPDDEARVWHKMKSRISGKSVPPELEFRFINKNGETRWVETLTSDIEYNGKPAFQAAVVDITERKSAEEALKDSEQRFRQVFENATVGIYRTTPNGRILMGNPRLVEMLGFSSFEDLAKRNLEDEGFEPEYNRAEFKNQIERDGHIMGLESIWKRQDGTKLYVRESARVIKDNIGNVLYYEGIVEDISDRKEAERIIIEERNRAELYLDILGHDINNLTQTITTSGELLLMDSKLPKKQTNFVMNQLNQAKAISELISNVRKLSDLKLFDFKTKEIDISEILENSIKHVKQQFPKRRTQINHTIPKAKVLVRGNVLLQDAFINILINAIKYDEHPDVVVEISYKLSEDDKYWRLEVNDHGPGIHDTMKEKIFNRLDRGDQSIQGTGLGLTIVNEIVTRCGGKVWVEDRVKGESSKGSKFILLLPKGK